MALSIASAVFTTLSFFVFAPRIRHILIPLFDWFAPIKWEVVPLLVALRSVHTILMIPAQETWGLLIGFFYGFGLGFLLELASSFFACCVAFKISRHCLSPSFAKWCTVEPTSTSSESESEQTERRNFDELIAYLVHKHGFLTVLAVRFFILPPATWTNHIFAHTQCAFASFAAATFLGRAFQSLISAYVGSQTKNILQVTDEHGNASDRDHTLRFVIPIAVTAIFVAVSVVIGFVSKRWMKRQREIYENLRRENLSLESHPQERQMELEAEREHVDGVELQALVV